MDLNSFDVIIIATKPRLYKQGYFIDLKKIDWIKEMIT